jgi:hypothetical protein
MKNFKLILGLIPLLYALGYYGLYLIALNRANKEHKGSLLESYNLFASTFAWQVILYSFLWTIFLLSVNIISVKKDSSIISMWRVYLCVSFLLNVAFLIFYYAYIN